MQTNALLKSTEDTRVSHPFRKGDVVSIIRLALFGRPFIEGRAIVEAPYPGVPDFYYVRFPGDPFIRERYAHAEHQEDPERMLATLLDHWRASMTPELLHEFFPGDR